MSPSQVIVREASRTFTSVDVLGRLLVLRRLTALDTLRLFKAAGPVLAQNEPWLSMAALGFAILEIDGVPVPAPVTEAQIEGLIDRLGDEGLAAIAAVIKDESPTQHSEDAVGNLRGIPS